MEQVSAVKCNRLLMMRMRNTIPPCYDPVYQEERRQADFDEFVDSLPHCIICGSAIFPGDKYHEAYRKPVCDDCFDELAENFDFVET